MLPPAVKRAPSPAAPSSAAKRPKRGTNDAETTDGAATATPAAAAPPPRRGAEPPSPPAAPTPKPASLSVPRLPMIAVGDAWYRGRVAADDTAGGRVLIECSVVPGVSRPFWLERASTRIWRGSYKGRDWKYLGDGAWEPKKGGGGGSSEPAKKKHDDADTPRAPPRRLPAERPPPIRRQPVRAAAPAPGTATPAALGLAGPTRPPAEAKPAAQPKLATAPSAGGSSGSGRGGGTRRARAPPPPTRRGAADPPVAENDATAAAAPPPAALAPAPAARHPLLPRQTARP